MGERMTGYRRKSLCYNPDDKIGKLIEQTDITSSDIRKLLWIVEGADYLRKNKAPAEQIEEHLFEALRYHAGKIAEIQALINLEKHSLLVPSSSTVLNNSPEINRAVEKDSGAKKSSFAERFKLKD
ncbi:MAG: hypothetical protein RLZZ171_2587 [Cyanobacteriota bacterium]|jgi:hypothetical protein